MTRELRMTGPNEGGSCYNCIFRDGLEPTRWSGGITYSKGRCRRHPPVVTSDQDGGVSASFPRVEGSDWCGEHRNWKTVRAVKGST
jgi:hypothetical protein